MARSMGQMIRKSGGSCNEVTRLLGQAGRALCNEVMGYELGCAGTSVARSVND